MLRKDIILLVQPKGSVNMIYYVEDDSSTRELVVYTLVRSGMEAKGFSHPDAFWKAMEKEVPQLILLDIMLPQEDGLHILQRIRENSEYSKIPVMMITAKGTEYDKVTGLDQGADDYLSKPFGMMEFVARVRALMRRSDTAATPQIYKLRELTLDPSRHEVKVDGKSVNLTYKEYELLLMMMKNQDLVMTRDRIISQIWGYEFDGESRTVDVHIRTLRQKLGKAGKYIKTVRGVGYKIKEKD